MVFVLSDEFRQSLDQIRNLNGQVYNRRVMTEPTTHDRAGRRREWLLKATFESALIVLSILGAFALNEWQTSRDRELRVATIMRAVHAEIESNLRTLEDANAYNAGVVTKLRKLEEEKQKTIPPDVHPRGLMIQPRIISSAWDSAQSAGIINDIPVETALLLGRTYANQRSYVEAMARLMDIFYGTLFQDASVLTQPGILAGVLSDFSGRGHRLAAEYQATLTQLAAVP
jgi:hypothetical protein